jgi:succinate-semialdehyde dehydrogenase/glutarate-semialdehyde dehydrogenase
MKAVNPATLEPLGDVPETPVERVPEIAARAREAARLWSDTPVSRRVEWALRLKELILHRRDAIAREITRSTGKPIFESVSAEVFPTCALLDTFARDCRAALHSEPVPIGMFNLFGRESAIEYRPVGWVLVISPWNYPFSISMGDAAMAVLAGCTVVLKPSEQTPLIGSLVEGLLRESGLPPDVAQVVHGDAAQAGALIEARPGKVVFTGSVATGKKIMEACARRLTPCVLELGGKNPALVLSDAELPVAADGILWGGFMNSGQACSAVGRVLVEREVAEVFLTRLIELARGLRQGDPMDPAVDIGCLTTAAQLAKVEKHVREAVSAGAKVALGGARPEGPGRCFAPTILTGVTPDMAIMREEVFGPVLPVMEVSGEEEAIRIANDCDLGLTASVWSTDVVRARRVASRLEAGTVTINDCGYTYAICETPWGGIKESGFGRTHSKLGLREFAHPIHVNINHRSGMRSIWWFPYRQSQIDLTNALLDMFHGAGAASRLSGFGRALRRFSFDLIRPRT